MTTLTEFLEARLREDESAALAWPEDECGWKAAGSRHLSYASGLGEQVGSVNVGGDYCDWERIYIKSDLDDDLSGYLARHDPARVLREVAAKRAILELADDATGLDMSVDNDRRVGFRDESEEPYIGDLILRQLAQAYSEHPDFNPEWSTT